jgi:hypothetical protein
VSVECVVVDAKFLIAGILAAGLALLSVPSVTAGSSATFLELPPADKYAPAVRSRLGK